MSSAALAALLAPELFGVLTSLRLNGTGLGMVPGGVKSLCTALHQGAHALQRLQLDANELRDADALELASSCGEQVQLSLRTNILTNEARAKLPPNVDPGGNVWSPDDKHEWVGLSDDLLEAFYSGGPDSHQSGNGMCRAPRHSRPAPPRQRPQPWRVAPIARLHEGRCCAWLRVACGRDWGGAIAILPPAVHRAVGGDGDGVI